MRKRRNKDVKLRLLQEQLRWEATRSSVQIDESAGRIRLEVEAEVPTALLMQVRQQKGGFSWLQEEVCGLLAQNRQQDSVKVEGLKAQLEALAEMFWMTQTCLEEQTSCIAVLQAQLDRIKLVNEGLEEDLQQARASYEARLLEQMDAMKDLLDKAEDHLDASWVYWQQENLSLLKHTKKLRMILKKKEEESEAKENLWRQEKEFLHQQMEALENILLQMEQE
ncbi:GRIP1-associated protein 1-like [Antennarius striatus]|uniref:GRIP1-associated protein 1-like n=1 Tax=Antennarius striatus TaxID=241820 RepID=UPI0035AF1FFC